MRERKNKKGVRFFGSGLGNQRIDGVALKLKEEGKGMGRGMALMFVH